jgi:hypothetical protein
MMKSFAGTFWCESGRIFVILTYRQRESDRRYEYYSAEGCWEMLKMDRGRELLELYSSQICEVFVGESALPVGAHAAAVDLLLERRAAAVECLKQPALRRNADFGRLLSRRLTSNELSAPVFSAGTGKKRWICRGSSYAAGFAGRRSDTSGADSAASGISGQNSGCVRQDWMEGIFR